MYLLLFTLFFGPFLDSFLNTEGKLRIDLSIDKKIIFFVSAVLITGSFFGLYKLCSYYKAKKTQDNFRDLINDCRWYMRAITYNGKLRLAKDYSDSSTDGKKNTNLYYLHYCDNVEEKKLLLNKIKKLNENLLFLQTFCLEQNKKIDIKSLKKLDKLITSRVELCGGTQHRFSLYNIIIHIQTGIWLNYLYKNVESSKQFIEETRSVINETQDITIKICDQCIKLDRKGPRKDRFADVKELLTKNDESFNRHVSKFLKK